ncbi:recombinase RecT [Facklamia miroungae]|uniref:Recombination protein RecT n=1 Tax=Facklamia miroungae TaxID=120956 RepID=A0A1G7NYI6_9LACT|nr:RecT family recombinase [Facklamia miroungae]NKZ28518.1 recombinase RecT [Facklamia miroungae]SDF79148.1 recombination protein RecT [Facklamia miroungae]
MANELAILQKDITDSINNRVNEMQSEGLALPKNYNFSNALKSAFFKLQETYDKNRKPALEFCTKESIANTLLDMVTQGLSPAKTQCYLVVYGDKLQLQRSYFGTQAVLKRLSEVKDIWANVIYEGDDFDYEIKDGRERFLAHKTELINRNNPIVGAYAVIRTSEEEELLTVMTMKEIQTSWSQSKTSQNVHKKFPQEMAKRTVINRAAKVFVNTSDDSDLLVETINRTTENEYDSDTPSIKDVTNEIQEKANKDVLEFDPIEPKKVQEPRENIIDASDVSEVQSEHSEQINILEPEF